MFNFFCNQFLVFFFLLSINVQLVHFFFFFFTLSSCDATAIETHLFLSLLNKTALISDKFPNNFNNSSTETKPKKKKKNYQKWTTTKNKKKTWNNWMEFEFFCLNLVCAEMWGPHLLAAQTLALDWRARAAWNILRRRRAASGQCCR